jgi:hypothetical protein
MNQSATKPPEKRPIDWEAIERDYRAGVMTLRQISQDRGVSHVAIDKRAKKLGWSRDLTVKIQAKAEELVNKTTVNSQLTESQVILENASQAAAIRLSQRKDFSRLRAIITGQMTELEESGGIELAERSKISKQLADTLRIAVDLERREFGMDKAAPADDPLTAMIKRINAAGHVSAFKPVQVDPAYSGGDDD